MRLNVYLRGIDLIDVEFHCGSKGLYLDVNVFQPRADDSGPSPKRAVGPVWEDDQPVGRHGFGFGRTRS